MFKTVKCCIGIVVLTACSGASQSVDDGRGGLAPGSQLPSKALEAEAPQTTVENHLDALVSISVSKTQTVEFYEFSDGTLVVERGPAGKGVVSALSAAKRATNPSNEPGHLVELFQALRPDLPVPDQLYDIDRRATSAPHGDTKTVPDPQFAYGDQGTPELRTQSPIGCNNGCCDPDWLPSICPTTNNGYWDSNQFWGWYTWGHLWTTAGSGSAIFDTQATVCSASGTSSWTFNHEGNNTWNIDEATYVQYSWTCSGSLLFGACSSAAISYVNSSTNPHNHAHCGYFYYY